MTESKNQMSEYIKEKILTFFLETSVPRIIKKERELKHNEQSANV